MKKIRLDILLAEPSSGYDLTRSKAAALIMEGMVSVNGLKCVKPGTQVEIDSLIEIKKKQSLRIARRIKAEMRTVGF